MNLNIHSNQDASHAKQAQADQFYRKGGYKRAVLLRRNFNDYENHLFAFLIDLNLCLIPVYVWAVEFILILTGMIPPMYFDLLFYVMYGLLFLCSCVALPLYTATTKGQTPGMRIMGLRMVRRSKKPASGMSLVLNELIGFGAPLVIFGYFFNIFGLLIYWLLNSIVVMVSPHQQSMADWAFNLVLVYVPELKADAISILENQDPSAQTSAAAHARSTSEKVKHEQPEEEPAGGLISPIDLHIRSNYSDDGSMDVEEIIKQARDKGMEVISITDHNCARANFQAVRFAQMYNIQYIPGVEVDAMIDGHRVRVLGYYIDWNKPVFDKIERDSLKREKEASIERVKSFEKLMGLRVDIDSILSRSRFQTITPNDLTYMVFHNAKTRKLPLIQNALRKADQDEKKAQEIFREEVFGKGGPCEVIETYPDAREIISEIHDANGLAVLAGWRIDDLPDDKLEALLDAGLDGVEAFNPLLDQETKTFLLSLAANEKLFVTAGSDFHGKNRPERILGVTTCPEKGLGAIRIFTRALDSDEEQA